MSNAPQSIQEAIDDFLATIAFPTARIAFSNVTFQPTAGVPYLSATMAAQTSTPLTLGADQSLIAGGGYLSEWKGTYEVTAVWPEDAGRAGCAKMQGQILRLFKRGTTLTCSDGLHVVFEQSSALPIRPDNAWVRGPVQAPWYCFEAS